MANRINGEDFYSWRTIGETGEDVIASDGLSVNAEYSIDDPDVFSELDIIIVCGGRRIDESTTIPVLRWLKAADKLKIALGSVCTGSYILAKAGLLEGRRCSVHWENIASLTNMFPGISVSRSVYTIDGNRYTCSGGTAPVDMMLHIVRSQLGAAVSAGIAEQFVHDRVRKSGDIQRVPLRHTVGNQSKKLIVAVELMEANIREPISQDELASYVGLSRRQLQRLFQRYLLCSPSRNYLQIRLSQARELLLQTDMNMIEVAAQTGFVSSSHFSKSYKEFYGYSPSAERRKTQESV
ncbi:MAG: GlxA family transcriptional regulator [Woeseiaceae bacterium]|nr:GlxA family transcriptional regulator [Woeseiaceae bacterium]